ncbi:MAG: PrsW family glutamic-type intramembrane protease [Geminicoccales bacterium]
MQISIAASAGLPAVALVYWLSRSSVFERPGLLVWLAFGLGALSVNASGLQGVFVDMLPFQPEEQLRLFIPIYVFLIAAPIEEIAKLTAVLVILWSFPLHDRPLALVGCGLAVGIGFAALENFSFGSRGDFNDALSRLDGFFLHAAFTGIAAIFLAFSKRMPEHRWRYWLLTIGVPVIIHGANNLLLSARKWFSAFDPSDPLVDKLSEVTLGLYGLAIYGLAIGTFVVLFAQLKRKVMGDREPQAWKVTNVFGTFLTTIGVIGVAKGFLILLLALGEPLLSNGLEGLLFLLIGSSIILVSFAMLKRGWRRLAGDAVLSPRALQRSETS